MPNDRVCWTVACDERMARGRRNGAGRGAARSAAAPRDMVIVAEVGEAEEVSILLESSHGHQDAIEVLEGLAAGCSFLLRWSCPSRSCSKNLGLARLASGTVEFLDEL